MTIESATYISGLASANPAANDPKSEGDDHIRLIKTVLKNSFSAVAGAVNTSHTELNYLVGCSATVQAQVNSKLALAGGTMAGDITMGDNDIVGLKTATFTAEYNAGNSGSSKTIAWANGLKQKVTLTASCEFAFTSPGACTGGLTLRVIQGSGGNYTVTWDAASNINWPGDTAPTMSQVANAVDLFTFYFDGTEYYGSYLQNYSP